MEMPLSFEIRLNPWGPIIIPAIKSPIIPGILNLFEIKGKNRKINSNMVKAITGSEIGF